MFILLPPSEGKALGRRGKPLAWETLSAPELNPARSLVLDTLVDLCSADAEKATQVLGLGKTQHDQVALNAALRTSPTLRADRLYTGVLYDALDLAGLPTVPRRRAMSSIAVTSSLFGFVRLGDRLPSYRLSGDTSLPGLGPVAAHWRAHLGPTIERAVGNGLFVDLRSSTYAAFWRPSGTIVDQTATLRVLHEVKGQRKVVSHFNKATKGRLVRSLLMDTVTPRTPTALADHLAALGWQVEVGKPTRTGTPLDVIVAEL